MFCWSNCSPFRHGTQTDEYFMVSPKSTLTSRGSPTHTFEIQPLSQLVEISFATFQSAPPQPGPPASPPLLQLPNSGPRPLHATLRTHSAHRTPTERPLSSPSGQAPSLFKLILSFHSAMPAPGPGATERRPRRSPSELRVSAEIQTRKSVLLLIRIAQIRGGLRGPGKQCIFVNALNPHKNPTGQLL